MEFSNFVDSQISQAKAELKESKQADNSLSYFKSMADEFKRCELKTFFTQSLQFCITKDFLLGPY